MQSIREMRSDRDQSDGLARASTGRADETISGNPRNDPETVARYFSSTNDAAARVRQEAHMNHSIHSADRTTHLKIVVVALVAGIAVAAFGISSRTNSDYTQTAHVVKAGKLMTVTSSSTSVVR
jgi:hypothetical protein